jgi:nucleotide-binding universal stress UspA family protein
MYRMVLVPLDGSAFAEQALPFAASIVRQTSAQMQIIRSHSPAALLAPDSEFVVDTSLDERVRKEEEAYLKTMVETLRAAAGVGATPILLPSFASEAICAHARASHADLIVMATHGRGGLSRFWLGSMADAMIRSVHVPLLLIHPKEESIDLATDFAPRKIMIPLDGSDLAEQAIEPAITLGTQNEAEYTLLRVVGPCLSPMEEFNQPLIDQFRERTEAYLKGVANKLRKRGLTVQTCAIVNQPIAPALLQQVRALGIDAIALATHGRGGLGRVLIGSVADKVIRGAEIPVLVHRCT